MSRVYSRHLSPWLFDGSNTDVADDFLTAVNLRGTASLISIGPVAAKGTADVHALYDSTTAAFPGPFTNPDVPRNLRVVKSALWDGGTVTVVGTDQFDAAQSETFNSTAETTVGTKIFKTVTGATKGTPSGVAGIGASIGTGDILGVIGRLSDSVGLGFVSGIGEAVTLDTTLNTVTFTSTPAATTFKLLANLGPS